MKGRQAYPYWLAALDVAGLLLAVEATVHLRVWLNPLFENQFALETARDHLPPRGIFLAVTLLAGLWVGLYRPGEHFVVRRIFKLVPKGTVLACMSLATLTLFTDDHGAAYARSLLLLYAVPATAVLAATPVLVSLGYRVAGRLGWGLETVAVVGTGREAAAMGRRLQQTPGRYRVVGYISRNGEAALPTACVPPERVLGHVADIDRIINTAGLDHVVVCDSHVAPADLLRCAVACDKMNVVLDQRPQTSCLLSDGEAAHPARLAGRTVLRFKRVRFTRRQQAAKRLLDLAAAALMAPVVAPVCAVIALLVKATSRGPVLHVAPRVGRGGRYFPFLKFRSMYLDGEARRAAIQDANEKGGHIFKVKHDTRVTPLGRWLRRLSLDELPQLWNVVRGDMSLVGPRPLPIGDMGENGFCCDVPLWSRVRMNVLPGITGLWQVSGRSDLPFEKMVRLDVEYVQRWSIWFGVAVWATLLVNVGVEHGIDAVLIGALAGDAAEVARYTVGIYPAVRLFAFLVFAFSAVCLPSLSAAHAQGGMAALAAARAGYVKLMAGVVVPVFAFLFVLAPEIMTGVYGPAYASSAIILRIMCLALVAVALMGGGVNANTLLALGRARLFFWSRLTAGAVNVVADVLLIPPLGALGAVVATASVIVGLHLFDLAMVRVLSGARLPERFLGRVSGATVGAILVLAFFSAESLWQVGVAAAGYVLLSAVLWVIARPLDSSDRLHLAKVHPALGRLAGAFAARPVL